MIAKALHLVFVLRTSKLFLDIPSFSPYDNYDYFYSAGTWNMGRLSNLGKVPKLCKQQDWVLNLAWWHKVPVLSCHSVEFILTILTIIIYSNYSSIY